MCLLNWILYASDCRIVFWEKVCMVLYSNENKYVKCAYFLIISWWIICVGNYFFKSYDFPFQIITFNTTFFLWKNIISIVFWKKPVYLKRKFLFYRTLELSLKVLTVPSVARHSLSVTKLTTTFTFAAPAKGGQKSPSWRTLSSTTPTSPSLCSW